MLKHKVSHLGILYTAKFPHFNQCEVLSLWKSIKHLTKISKTKSIQQNSEASHESQSFRG